MQARKITRSPRTRPRTPRLAAASRGPLDGLLDPLLFKALGDPVRARLLSCVAKCGRACSVGEVAECCQLDLSTVSRHLATLARAGAMVSLKQGTSVLYSVRCEHLAAAFTALASAMSESRPSGTCCPPGCSSGCSSASSSHAAKRGGRHGCR